ncbi:TolB family protein, partial [candidate division KSB1 bacterium]
SFRSNRDGSGEIFVMNADGSNQTNLTNNSDYDGNPSWSPDGSKIAFDSDRNGKWEIYIMNSDGTNQTRLTNNPSENGFPAWSPYLK